MGNINESLEQSVETMDTHEQTNEIFKAFPAANEGKVLTKFLCPICRRVFKRQFELNRHMNKHTGGKTHKCNVCFETFSSSSHLSNHKNKVHTLEKNFICNVCCEEFESKYKLFRHLKSAHSLVLGTFLCELCNIKFDSKGSLIEHDKTVHKREGQNTCLFCGKHFSYPSDLKRHERKHTGFRPYKCSICEKTYPRGDELANHLKHHFQKNSRQRNFICGECNKSYKCISDLKRHMRRDHQANLPFTCHICRKVFSMHDEYRSHRQKVHGILVMSKEEMPIYKYECEYCEKKFRYPSDLKRHISKHSTKGFKCTICEKPFKADLFAKRHELSHMKPKDDENTAQVNCDICNRLFSKHGIAKHVKLHFKDIFPCKKCAEVFNTKDEFLKHMRNHLKADFECEYCHKHFQWRHTLKMHVRIHTKETPFQCDMCGLQFKQNYHLKRHLSTHYDTQKLPCKYCHRRYSSDYLKRHMRKHGIIIENGLVVDNKEPLDKNSKDEVSGENNVHDDINDLEVAADEFSSGENGLIVTNDKNAKAINNNISKANNEACATDNEDTSAHQNNTDKHEQ